MSGKIRTAIPLLNRTLKNYIEKLQTDFESGTYEYDDKNPKECEKIYLKTQKEIKKLEPNFEKLKILHSKWEKSISQLKGDEKRVEQKVQRIFQEKHDYLSTLGQADDLLDTFKDINLEVKRKLKTLNTESQKSHTDSDDEVEADEDEEEAPEPEEEDSGEDEFTDELRSSEFNSRDSVNFSRNRINIKLPAQTLTHFNGKFSDWSSFWDDFSSSVHISPDLSNIQKFKYLKGLLHGEPYNMVNPYPLNHANYPTVLKLLKSRYGNKNLIRENLHNELRNIRKSSESVRELRSFILVVNRIILQLQSHGEDINHPQIKQSIETKLPTNLRIKIREKFKIFSTNQLMKFLDNHTQAREELERVEDSDRPSDRPSRPPPFNRPTQNQGPKLFIQKFASNSQRPFSPTLDNPPNRPTPTSAFSTKARPLPLAQIQSNQFTNRDSGQTIFCRFCEKDNHISKNCKTFADVNHRSDRAKELKLCMNCLRKGHRVEDCKSTYLCFNCKKKHNTLLCFQKAREDKPTWQRTKTNIVQTADQVEETQSFMSMDHGSGTQIPNDEELLMTIEAPIVSLNKKFCQTTAILFDNGSQKSYITEDLANKLELPTIEHKTLLISTFNQDQAKLTPSRIVQVGIKTTDEKLEIVNLQTVEKITDITKIVPKEFTDVYGIKIPVEQTRPELLIGIDHYWNFMLPHSHVESLPSGFHSINTKLGKIFSGKGTIEQTQIYHAVKKQKMEDINKLLQKFWELETIGITDSPHLSDDDAAVIHFNKNVSFEKGRYFVRWPYKKENPDLPTNFGLCFGRLRNVVKQLIKTNQLSTYNHILQEQMVTDVNELVGFKSDHLIHYLPHHPVIKETSNTTKVRPVFDASAKLRGHNSLNDQIFQGPKLLPDLCGMILRFRLKNFVLLGDLEKAFLRVGLNESDRDTTRFLWLKENSFKEIQRKSRELEIRDLEIRRFKRIPFGVNASPFLLTSVVNLHLSKINDHFDIFKDRQLSTELNISSKRKEFEQLCEELKENAYVDNFMMMCDDEKEIKFKHYWSKEIFKLASMNLREFVSNHDQSNKEIQRLEGAEIPKVTKMLGIKWDVNTDELKMTLNIPQINTDTTKRQILTLIARNFDPMGWISPAVLQFKLFFQRLWKANKTWDDKLNEEEISEWNSIAKSDEILIIRSPFIKPHQNFTQLHVFSDASELAFATAVYLQTYDKVNLVFSKTRLTPLKGLTIPKLELLGLLIAARAAKFLVKESKLTIDNILVWSDSKCVLSWVKSKKELPTFIKNRVSEIRQIMTEINLNFCYVKSSDNPADLASRGMTITELKNSALWWHGPKWLKMDKENWPPHSFENFNPEQENSSFFSFDAEIETTQINLTINSTPILFIEWSNFNSWQKLIRHAKVFLQFVHFKFKNSNKFNEKFDQNAFKNQLSVKLMAEKLLIRFIQKEMKPTPEEQRQLGIYQASDDFYKCGGRLKNAQIQGIHPIFLPRKHKGTHLLIMDYHEHNLHTGTMTILAELRKIFWIPKARRIIDQIRKTCIYCRRYNAQPFKQPGMPPLPKSRVQMSGPFQNVGLDYMGPIQLKACADKCWILLLTCFTTRAIHLELVTSLSVEQFLNAFRRFISRKGTPKNVWSDNAAQLKLASKVIPDTLKLKEVFNDPAIKHYFLTERINWHFSIELAPWQNGAIERLNLNVKSAMKKLIGRKLINFDSFNTLLCEIEALVNSRPLTFIYDDIDSYKILRPIDFILPHKNICIPPILEENEAKDPNFVFRPTSYDQKLELWKKSTSLLDGYWKIWSEEYIPSLRERYKTENKNPKLCNKSVPAINDVVLIHEDTPRALWKTGIIKDLFKGSDGLTRGATIELANKHTINRPLKLIYPLEITPKDSEFEETLVELSRVSSLKSIQNSPNFRKRKPEFAECSPDKSASCQLVVHTPPKPSTLFNSVPSTSLTFITIFSLITAGLSHTYKCPVNETSMLWETKLTTYCSNTGFIIKQNKRTSEFCFHYLSSASGHIRFNYFPYCGPRCTCPSWSHDCSFASLNTVPTVFETTFSSHKIIPPLFSTVCSFKRTNSCSKAYRKYFNTIMLTDHTIFFVQRLNLIHSQINSKNEFRCLGEGNLTIGTPMFCKEYPCIKQTYGTKFCYYEPYEKTYYAKSDNEKLLIKAWGNVKLKYYELEHSQSRNKRAANGSKFENLIKCVSGGVMIYSITNVKELRLFTGDYSVIIKNSIKKKEIVSFPISIIAKVYNITIQFVKTNGSENKYISCQASPVCELITCQLCMEYIRNPQCIGQVHWALILTSILLALYIITLSLKIISLILSIIRRILKCLYNCCKRKQKPIKIIKSKRKPFILLTLCFSVFIHVPNIPEISACDETTNLVAGTNDCAVSQDGHIECNYDQTTQISVTPEHMTCLKLQNTKTNKTMETLQIVIDSLAIVCDEKSEYFMRNYQLSSSSQKRCSGAGDCTGQVCQKLTMSQRNPGVSKYVNDQPGYSYCVPSCGGWHCDCFLSVDGCLFYRTYAESSDNYLYEIIKCPSWTILASIKLSFDNKQELLMELKPGILTHHKNSDDNSVSVTLTSTSIPPTPLFGSKFIINRTNNKTIIIDNDHLLTNSLRCEDKGKATNFQCTFPPEACQCHGGDSIVHCECEENPLPKMFQKAENLLPLDTQGAHVYFESQLKAKIRQTSALQMQITLKGHKVKAIYDKNTCTITTKSLEGCYSCPNGANWTLSCKTNFGTALANIQCPSQRLQVHCDTKGKHQQVKLNYRKETIKESCSVICPDGTSTIILEAKLIYIVQQDKKSIAINNSIQEPVTGTSFDQVGEILKFISSFLQCNWFQVLIAILFLAFLILFIPFILPFIYSICYSRKRRQIQPKTPRFGSVASAKLIKKLRSKNKIKKKL